MQINLKKGKCSDIYIEITTAFMQNLSTLKLKDLLDANEIGYGELALSEQQFPFLIKFYLDLDKETKMKKKEKEVSKSKQKSQLLQAKDSKSLVRSDSDIVSKYANFFISSGTKESSISKPSFLDSKENSLGDSNKFINKCPTLSNYKPATKPSIIQLKLIMLYATVDILRDHYTKFMAYIEDFEQSVNKRSNESNDSIKLILLLEDIHGNISSENTKSLRKKIEVLSQVVLTNNNDFFLDQNQNYMIEEEEENANSCCTVFDKSTKKPWYSNANKNINFKSEEDFDDWLMGITIDNENIDYKITNDVNESIEYLSNCISAVIYSKYKRPLGRHDQKTTGYSAKSQYAGFDDEYSLSWISILMAISGISEEKAISIAKNYPSIKSLMESYENIDSSIDKEKLLENINVVYNFDENKSKQLGKANSNKVYRVFTSENPNDYVQFNNL